ncbi:MAG: hypothetical protein WCI18_07190 [Pseudomonadota bacterium]
MLRKSIALAFLFVSSLSIAAEVSLLTGGYSSIKRGTDKSSVFELGGRYHEAYDKNIELYYLLGLIFRNYSEGGDSNGIEIGGGARYYGTPFSTQIKPYVALQGWYKNDEQKLFNTKESGIYYSGLLGFRFVFNEKVFFDLEGDLFESALASSKKETKNTSATQEETETTTSQLRASSRNDNFFSSLKVGVGMTL